MSEAMRVFFSAEIFMPHGHCLLWTPSLLWLEIVSNGIIAVSCLAAGVVLATTSYARRGPSFRGICLLGAIFFVTSGLTHVLDVWTIWSPRYWVDGALRAVTAVAALGTALALPRLIARAGAPSGAPPPG